VTQTRADVSLTISRSLPTGSGCASGAVLINYQDNAGLFGSLTDLEGPITVYWHSAAGQLRDSRTLLMPRVDDKTFLGVWCGLAPPEDVDMVELAFGDGHGRWDSNASHNYLARFANRRFTAALTSGVGARLTVDYVDDWPTGAACATPGFFITYEDTRRYFGDAQNIRAVAQLERHAGLSSGLEEKVLVLTSDGSGVFRGISCASLGGPEVLDTLQLAFSDLAQQKWDSNLSRNYSLHCSF
jgi:hypothetical protein